PAVPFVVERHVRIEGDWPTREGVIQTELDLVEVEEREPKGTRGGQSADGRWRHVLGVNVDEFVAHGPVLGKRDRLAGDKDNVKQVAVGVAPPDATPVTRKRDTAAAPIGCHQAADGD